MVRLAWLRQHGFWLTLFFLVTLAVLLRSIGFGQVPVSLYWDEMAIWNDARSIATTGLDLHGRSWFQPLFISYGDYKLPVYIWFVSFVSRFVDSAALAVRLPSFLAGVSMVFGGAVFWLGVPDLKTDLKRKLALVTAAVITVMPWSIHFSTVGFEGHLSSAFVLWSAVALMWSVSRKHWQWRLAFVGLSVFLGTLSVYTYFSTRFVWPVIFVVLVAAWWTKTRQWWWLYGIGLFIWMFSLLPMVQADFYAASNQLRLSTESILTLPAAEPTALNELRLQSGNTFVSKAIYNRWTLTALAGGKNVLQHFDPEYLFFQGDQKLRHGVPGYGLLYGLFAPFLVIGVLAIWRRSWRVGGLLIAWWLAALVPASVPLDTPHALRSLNAVFVLAAFAGYGVVVAGQWWWEQSLPRWIRRLGLVMTLVLVALCTIRFTVTRVVVYPQLSATEWQAGYTPLAQYISTHHEQYETVFVNQFDDRFFLYYQPKSGLSWSEIQAIPSEGFARQTLGNVEITLLDFSEAESETMEFMYVVPVEKRETTPENWLEIDTIRDETGKERFVVFTSTREE